MKKCTTCGVTKALSEFYVKWASCKACESVRRKRWRIDNPEKARAQDAERHLERKEARNAASREYGARNRARLNATAKAWYWANKERAQEKERKNRLRRKYDLTPQAYEALWQSQGGRCKICSDPVLLRGRLTHVDHCHRTGRVRDILCQACNTWLGRFERLGAAGLRRVQEYVAGAGAL